MEGTDEIVFTGEYKDFKLGLKFDLDGKTEEDVIYALDYIHSSIEKYAFKFSGINTQEIDKFAQPKGKGLKTVCDFLENNSSSEIKTRLTAGLTETLSSGKEGVKLLSAAESYLLNQLLTKAEVQFTVKGNSTMKPAMEKPDSMIGFIGKYKKWVAIKKLGLDKVNDYEVAGILAGINHSVVNKGFDFAGPQDDATVLAVTKGKRKSYGNAASCLRELEGKLTGKRTDAFLVSKVLETIGIKPYASPEMLTDAYPDIKPPKVKGRKPKG
ncbi:DUF2666 family protein [Candidatus Micrarchaeota archaeon]|nr:DUF2666 family protein [Candidatus Micrarchaeota archaeon]